jgi:hypothetical protein
VLGLRKQIQRISAEGAPVLPPTPRSEFKALLVVGRMFGVDVETPGLWL